MSELAKTVKSFAEEVLARLTGDDNAAVAAKNERKARSAFNQQISAKEAQIVDAEVAVEEAQEALNDALYPTTLINSTEEYISNIAEAQDVLTTAKDELETLRAQLKFFQDDTRNVLRNGCIPLLTWLVWV
jgi:ubiquinone biosynthesis protein UbiJ